MISLPPLQTPLYNHPLPALEQWLSDLGACRDHAEPCLWDLRQPLWSARIELEVEELKVSWEHGGRVTVRLFPYGLSRADVESAILAGP
ncbi:DUF3143 domain-containing protein [Synechococcus sp. Cruz-9H2]|jgi:hypothetical protein|uniref:DUF3143 domain-containing protein n=1 Tax=unclassified Synechococcus TaxID=2626047 RepID=UPI0020CCFBD6|nr:MULTISPECIES: DUF3143 domain-containing protein [unclassified Synechococcus]MCP9819072.1 DUF3143 domain-containing protein [Synechococcus sp. Cruz-9H2]MCP9843576.1 DUF3143 domain-containing protein [Synechococcus sp. Edmonson 11F2]MCP9855705.1 DUF3143 domain-containing protein [Synechococcus sp. Cruz-9C9]MCP9863143.1 DUF3143 domain-containing protein [Synechococcus sp. Cruz-7E5]MCP9869982.1 DUF3143 domain-containing protein [Synechococcus sp. Cruz-7B9]